MARWYYLLCKKKLMGGYVPVRIYTALDAALGACDSNHVVFKQCLDGELIQCAPEKATK